ncbi:MAG: hypothetical protein ACREO1_02545 [Arenimonas sp.]
MKNLIVICILVFCSAADAKEYIYTNYSLTKEDNGGRFSHKISITRGVEWRGHSGQKLTFCKPSEEFYCIYSGGTHFAVPKKKLSLGDVWEHKGKIFRIIGSEYFNFLGKKISVDVISSEFNSNRTDYFYYSAAKGLVAIKYEWKGDDDAKFYLLEDSRGFPF